MNFRRDGMSEPGPRGVFSATGATGVTGPILRNFRSIDLDVWARKFLATVDLCLSAAYASPLFQMGGPTGATGPTGPSAAGQAFGATGFTAGGPGRAAFETLAGAKKKLAERIAEGLDYILAGPTGPTADILRRQARETLRQNLLMNLSSGYETDALLQPRFLIESGVRGATAPRLSGQPVPLVAEKRAEGPLGYEQAYSISTGKLPLTDPESSSAFLFNVPSEARQRSVNLDLTYAVNEMEYDIQGDKIEDYEPSSWLTFVVPLGSTATQPEVRVDTNLGQLEIPIPLRAYPVLPSLMAQGATASMPGSDKLAEAKLWDYSATFEYQPAAQDTLFMLVMLNIFEEAGGGARASAPDLFDWLAQFAAIYPELQNDLSLIPAWRPGASYDAPVRAALTLADLAEKIAETWRVYPPAPARPDDPHKKGQAYLYRLDLTRSKDEQYLETLKMTLLEHPAGATLPWPAVYAGDQKLEPMTPSPNEITYKYPAGIEASAPLTQMFVFAKNDILRAFNAWMAVSIARNLLLASSGGAAAETNPGFVYTTPLAGFTNKLTPLLVHTAPIDIAKLGPTGGTGYTLAEYLRTLFGQLLEPEVAATPGPKPDLIKVACSYGYALAELPGPGSTAEVLMAYLPILLQPKFKFQAGDLGVTGPTAFVSRLASHIETWQKDNQPSTQHGMYSIGVSVFSPEGPTGPSGMASGTEPAAPEQPIFEVPNFQLKLGDIGPSGQGGGMDRG